MLSFGRAVSTTVWTLAALAVVASTVGCRSERRATLKVTVTQRDDLPPITRVVVSASGGNRMASATVEAPTSDSAAQSVSWPVEVTLDVANLPRGETVVEATAFDASKTMVARGTVGASLPTTTEVQIELRCQSLLCSQPAVDGGAPVDATSDGAEPDISIGDDGGSSSDTNGEGPVGQEPRCGNGVIDPGEVCDVGRSADLPGACPVTCDDGIPCTADERHGDGCGSSCAHIEIIVNIAGDSCCPAGADFASDPDCSATCGNQRVDPGETCDTGLPSGAGACPGSDSCNDGDPCTVDRLLSAGTCSARCVHEPIALAVNADGCCPVAANAMTDSDCPPACGNGVVEPGEFCEVASSSDRGACPTPAGCDDGNPCTIDSVSGSGCQAACRHDVIVTPAPGDGCCPIRELARNIDPDCPALCGNGVLEAAETCDAALPSTMAGACPTSCPPPPFACVRYRLVGTAADCSASCVAVPVSGCGGTADGCCPSGCTNSTDPDCSATCGNGVLDAGETCDTAIAGSGPGACPKTCADGVPCTDDLLVDGGTCNARCQSIATTALRNGDGCCPPNAYAGIDSDCPSSCGNGVVETPAETCDTATNPPSCPASCPPIDSCSTWLRTVTSACDVRCTRRATVTCAGGDNCCAPGCNATNDSDCPARCGNGVVEANEVCDKGITAGHAGACETSCADGDSCTVDIARGSPESCSRDCSHVRVTACGGGDNCCPAGCSGENDDDCTPVCGDGHVQATETCDPSSTCPTSCPSDGDACTVDQLVGAAALCNAACVHLPILRCSGVERDGCCPTDCSTASDSDC